MPTPILATKLYVPPPPPNCIRRSRLLERLEAGRRRKLSLISAPAGFGKSTLVSEWIASSGQPAAWLSLDEEDNEPARFWAYFIAALQTVAPAIGHGVLAQLHAPQPPATESLLTVLLNEISGISDAFVLVLDDYHLIQTSAIDEALIFLLAHQPSQMHLIITTREDPPWPLARYRVRSQMTELRATDLRFSPAEAVGFFRQVMGLDLTAQDVAALEARTEGWAAGLQMAALSLQGRTDTSAFIRAFTGSHRFVLDYLVEEVLQRQPPAVRDFLLQTSILDRLSGPLCDAVTGLGDSAGMLVALERGNLFVLRSMCLPRKVHWR